jgi:Protein of unknown function (DUF998)
VRRTTAARIAFGFALAFVAILAALHILESDFNVGGHLISEYELGRYGWLMSLAFFCLGGASLSLWYAIQPDLVTVGGRVGNWGLLLTAIAYVGAGLFYPDTSTGLGLPQDPIMVNRQAVAPTLSASLHGLFGVIVIVSSPIVFTLLYRSLAKNPQWASQLRSVRWATVLAWVGLLSLPVSLALYSAMQRPGGFDYRVIVSVFNRFMILTYAAWLAVVAQRRLQRANG